MTDQPEYTVQGLLPCHPQADNAVVHGHARHGKESPTYHSWMAMNARCRLSGRENSDRYHDKGIRVCQRWQDSFEAFLLDMGERPEGTTIDRQDGSKGYEPGNCKWSTPTDQARNRRNARLNFETAVEVAKARLRGERCKSIAERYGCSESLPREIVKGRTWKDALLQARRELGEGP